MPVMFDRSRNHCALRSSLTGGRTRTLLSETNMRLDLSASVHPYGRNSISLPSFSHPESQSDRAQRLISSRLRQEERRTAVRGVRSNSGIPDLRGRSQVCAHSATKFGDQQLFSEMTLGTFPSMAPYQKSCWHSLYFNCGQDKLDPQNPLFFTAFWV